MEEVGKSLIISSFVFFELIMSSLFVILVYKVIKCVIRDRIK